MVFPSSTLSFLLLLMYRKEAFMCKEDKGLKGLAKMFRDCIDGRDTLSPIRVEDLKAFADKLDPLDTASLEMAKHDWSIALRYRSVVAFQQCRKCGMVRMQGTRNYEKDGYEWTIVLQGINDDCT